MQSVSSGYTMVEVMIFLAISAVMLTFSFTFLSGANGRESFSQSMRDIQSKTQSWLDDVSNGFAYGSPGDSYCGSGGLPGIQINSGTRPVNYQPYCIFLGKAIQFVDGSNNVYAYSVFGKRLNPVSLDLAATIKDTGPVPGVGKLADGSSAGTGTAQLTEVYPLGPGTTVKGVIKPSIAGGFSHMAGLYLSLNTDQSTTQNGESNVNAYQYNLGSVPGLSSTAVDCIEDNPPCALLAGQTDPTPLTDWEICFQNDSNNDTALLTILSNGGEGISTQLAFKTC